MITCKNPNTAFTLVEMSITLGIIGLIMGSIVAANKMVANAQNRAVISEYNKYVEAISNFKLTYNALPGDFLLGTSTWSSCSTAAYCNGNGNGYIEPGSAAAGSGFAGVTPNFEGKIAWMHLSLASIIPGLYDGPKSATWSSNTSNTYPNSNKPKVVWAFDQTTNASTSFYTAYSGVITNYGIGNVLTLVGFNLSSFFNGISALDAYSIDQKIDDGLPNVGKVAAGNFYFSTASASTSIKCTSNDGTSWPYSPSSAATYYLTNPNPDSQACTMYFYFDDHS